MKRPVYLAISIAAYLAAIVLFRPHPTPGPAMRDFEAYYAAGASWSSGNDAYGRDIWKFERAVPGVDAAAEAPLPYVNAPLLLPVFALFARLPYAAACFAWGIVLAAALAALVLASLGLAGRARDGLSIAAVLPLALAFGPISSDLALGQLALLAAAGLAVAAWAFQRGRSSLGGAGAFVAALTPAVALPLIAWCRNWRALHGIVAAAITFLLLWTVMAATSAGPSLLRYLQLLREHTSAERFALIQYTPAAIAHGFGTSDDFALWFGFGLALTAVIAWAVVAWRRRNDALVSFAAACAMVPLIVPFFHEHDFAMVFPACAIVASRAGASQRAWAMLATLLIAVDWLGVAQRPDGLVQTILLGIAVLAALLAIYGGFDWRGWLLCAAAFALVVTAGLAAVADPAPVWPDAMRAFAISPGASLAVVWRAEQAASGMFAPDRFWALLRCAPLLGCVLLVWLSARAPQSASDSKIPSSVPAPVR
jgi:hypothetical protein